MRNGSKTAEVKWNPEQRLSPRTSCTSGQAAVCGTVAEACLSPSHGCTMAKALAISEERQNEQVGSWKMNSSP